MIENSYDASLVDSCPRYGTFLAIRKEIETSHYWGKCIGLHHANCQKNTGDGSRFALVRVREQAISIGKAAQAWAYLAGRDYVTPDDMKMVAKPSLRHRIQLSPHVELEGAAVDQIIEELVGSVPVPR